MQASCFDLLFLQHQSNPGLPTRPWSCCPESTLSEHLGVFYFAREILTSRMQGQLKYLHFRTHGPGAIFALVGPQVDRAWVLCCLKRISKWSLKWQRNPESEVPIPIYKMGRSSSSALTHHTSHLRPEPKDSIAAK